MTIPQHFLSFAAVTIDTKRLPLPRPSKPQTPSLQSPLFILILAITLPLTYLHSWLLLPAQIGSGTLTTY